MPAVTYALQCEILRVKYRCYDSAESVTRTHALLVKTKPSSWQRLISRFPLRGWESVEVGCTHLILSPLICICVTPVTAFFCATEAEADWDVCFLCIVWTRYFNGNPSTGRRRGHKRQQKSKYRRRLFSIEIITADGNSYCRHVGDILFCSRVTP